MSYALVVDPEAARRSDYQQLFTERKLAAIGVESAEAALAEVGRRGRPAVVLGELALPKMNGLGLLRELRRRFGDPPVPAVAVSSSLELRNQAVQEKAVLGLSAILAKTSPMTSIHRALGSALGQAAEAPKVPPPPRHAAGSGVAPPYLQIVVENSPEGALLLDEHRRVLFINRAAAEMAGLAPSEVEGIDLDSWIMKCTKAFEDPAPYLSFVKSIPRDRPLTITHNFEVQHPRRRMLKWSSRPVTLPGGIGHLFSYRDVTPEIDLVRRQQAVQARLRDTHEQDCRTAERAQGALRSALERTIAQRSLASLGIFAASLSHQLGNPMAFVTANLRSLQKDLSRLATLPDLVTEYRQEVIPETLSGVERVNQVLVDLRRLAQEQEEEPALLDVNEQVEAAADAVERRFPGYDLALEPGPVPPVTAKRGQLVRVLVNLLTNAVLAVTRESGQITVSTHAAGGEVRVEVRDNGVGIPPEARAKLFAPFFTTRERGVGMGLAMSHGLVKSFGGDIDVASEPGKGSCFTVRLPVERRIVALPS